MLVAGLNWPAGRIWLWIPALGVAGIGCVVNARRCGRLHCYVTGPFLLLAALYVVLAGFNFVPLQPGRFLLVVLVVSVGACLAELPLGRYVKKA